MRYLGGKARIARKIAEVIAAHAPDKRRLWEPFMGGGNATQVLAPYFTEVEASDVHEDLVLMWQALLSGWEPDPNVTDGAYQALRFAPPSAQRGFAGFAASFGGRWFGGYARDGKGMNYGAAGARSLATSVKTMGNVRVARRSYSDIRVSPGDVVYCDPPYAATTGYQSSFDPAAFWDCAGKWVAEGATVFVSEYDAPRGWECLWSVERVRGLRSAKQTETRVTERLFWIPPYNGENP